MCIRDSLMIGTLVILPLVGLAELLSFEQSIAELLTFDDVNKNSLLLKFSISFSVLLEFGIIIIPSSTRLEI